MNIVTTSTLRKTLSVLEVVSACALLLVGLAGLMLAPSVGLRVAFGIQGFVAAVRLFDCIWRGPIAMSRSV